jgi:hypothetical protein
MTSVTVEGSRLAESRLSRLQGDAGWRRWGPYLSERAWGTVREDYSAHGDAWNYFPHDHARSRAYRWNEDGLGGFSDDRQHLCLAVALWNERDPILKERLFGLTNGQGNHGEDVKEYYFFLDGTPTHSYMKMLYKYPQVAYPYGDLVEVNGRRSQAESEYELFDAIGDAFRAGRYFDVFIEYAKAGPEDLYCRITAYNRGPDPAPLHLLPHLWRRNTWSWRPGQTRPAIKALAARPDLAAAYTDDELLGGRWWYVQAAGAAPPPAATSLELLFTENETNAARLWGAPNPSPYVKDGIDEAVVNGRRECANSQAGSKAAAHAQALVPAGGAFTVLVRLSNAEQSDPFAGCDAVFAQRIAEAGEFYAAVHPPLLSDDERLVQRQAFAGLLWSKQFYHYDVQRWLEGDPTAPPPPEERWHGRNWSWKHLNNSDVLLMPDTWEYPWYASWDLAFHCVALARIDPDFAKDQLLLMGYEWYQHANGQVPAYEWSFDDVNPPVLAWAALRVYRTEQALTGQGDLAFLEEAFHSLMLQFSWWLNRKDPEGRDIFGGGFLGMDNIGVFDRDQPLPNGGTLNQSDGTSWMAKFCASMLGIAVELGACDRVYENMATKYFEHYLYIARAISNMGGGDGFDLWDDVDRFFYDLIHLDSGENIWLRIHSMVGLVPLFAAVTIHPDQLDRLPVFKARALWFLEHRPNLTEHVARFDAPGQEGRWLMSVVDADQLRAILRRMLDSAEFLSDHGVRAVSRYHLDHPYVFEAGGQRFDIHYLPAESDNRLFGGNSNWRGPIWFPVNYLIVRALEDFGRYYGDAFVAEMPTGSGKTYALRQVAEQLAGRLTGIFLRDPARNGQRAVFGDNDFFQTDPQWRDYIPFYEYFNGDTGAGLGASHQTGWTALVASLLCDYPAAAASGGSGDTISTLGTVSAVPVPDDGVSAE